MLIIEGAFFTQGWDLLLPRVQSPQRSQGFAPCIQNKMKTMATYSTTPSPFPFAMFLLPNLASPPDLLLSSTFPTAMLMERLLLPCKSCWVVAFSCTCSVGPTLPTLSPSYAKRIILWLAPLRQATASAASAFAQYITPWWCPFHAAGHNRWHVLQHSHQ